MGQLLVGHIRLGLVIDSHQHRQSHQGCQAEGDCSLEVTVLCMMGLQIAGEDSMIESSGRTTFYTSGMRRTAFMAC